MQGPARDSVRQEQTLRCVMKQPKDIRQENMARKHRHFRTVL
jgi:hypothetical protein